MTTLNYDANGFILGVAKMSEGIDNVHDDTQEIIAILKSQNQISNTRMRELTRAVTSASYRTASQDSNDVNRARSNSPDRRPRITSASNQTDSNRTTPSSRSPISRNSTNANDRARANRSNLPAQNQNQNSDSDSDSGNGSPGTRKRGANGRFISEGSGSGFESSGRGGIGGFGSLGSLGGANVSGVDPLLDSLKEAKDVLSPLGRGAKMMGRGAKLSWSKLKSMKRREPLSNEESRHNNENEKLLDKIWKAIKAGGGRSSGAGAGLLGGLLGAAGAGGGLLKKLSKFKILGPLAALAGAGSLAMDWGNLDHEGKSEGVGGLAGAAAGGLAGMKLGAMAGAIGGPIGAAIGGTVGAVAGSWLGSEGGEALGSAASPYVQDWTNSLIAYDLPKKMDNTWNAGIKPFFNRMDSLAGKFNSWIESKFSSFKDALGFGGGGNGSPAADALKAADYAIKNAANESLGKCAEYVNNAFQAQGLKASGNGVDVATNLMQQNKGKFEQVGYDENYQPQVGDVMSMPSSKKAKHNYGHVAVYTDQGWVSDYKQGEKYGNTAAPNADYAEDIASGRIKPTVARMINNDRPPNMAGQTGDMRAKSDQAMKYFTSQGWSREQAAGIVGNLQKESGFDPNVKGDGGKAHGIAQWHPDRQANFKAKFGKDINKSSYAEQLAFVQHELTRGSEQGAGQRLKNARTAAQAGAVVSEFYERPANKEGEKRERAQIAESINKNYATTSNKTPAPKSGNGILGFSTKDVKPTAKVSKPAANTPLTSSIGYAPANLPAPPMLKIPAMPNIKERLDSGGSNKPIMLQASNDTINQNVSDRGLAHAVTGGIGQDRHWG